ncbi:GNAT family N-acetyltransferase [Aspergillus undulatus]|uniref:GNAT family N-acetyltransferase n=1 Tax=Aspergillus undulatus TaxID=1810928 RepID=UPI003CCDDAD4
MSPPSKTTSKILTIPRSTEVSGDDLRILITRHKILRLTGLQTDPEAFTSTYDREIEFSNEVWATRVLNPLGRTFVALFPELDVSGLGISYAGGAEGDLRRLILHQWLGQLSLLGPVGYPLDEEVERAPWELFKNIDFERAARDAAGIRSVERVCYVLVGMYVLPEGRGAGNGRRLLEAAVRAVDEERIEKGVIATVVVLVAKENSTAKRLYERAGFTARPDTVDIEREEHWALFLTMG